MKKIASVTVIALLAIGFTSCKKDYTCTCKDNTGKEAAKYTFPKVKKKDAKTACDSWNNTFKISGGSCAL